MMQVRPFTIADTPAIAQLFHDTVRAINSRDYSHAQIQAWAPDDPHFRDWTAFCTSRFTYVAEDTSQILGFGMLETNGHLDCLYSHKDYQGRGVGREIYQTIAAKALELGLSRLFTEASITAKPFFERLGFVVIAPQTVTRRGQTFRNYAMEKILYS